MGVGSGVLRQLKFAKQSNEEEEGAHQERNSLESSNSFLASGLSPYNNLSTIQLVYAKLTTLLLFLTTILSSE